MFDISNRLFKIIAGFLAVLTVYFGFKAYFDYKSLPQNNIFPETVSITGEGKAMASPDIAKTELGITTEGARVETIVQENNTKMNALIASLKTLGIADKDIKTKTYSLQPRYEFDQNGRRISRGYTLNQSIEVKIRDFTKIGQVLEIAASSGANNIGDLQFAIDDIEKAKAEARSAAIAQAKAKAKAISEQTGIKFRKLSSLYEDNGAYPYPMYDSVGLGSAMAKEVSSITPPTIQSGEQEITVRITLNYRVK